MLIRYVTSFVCNLRIRGLRNGNKTEFCQFYRTTAVCQKKKKSGGWFWRKRPDIRADSSTPIIDPACKVAVVVGGCGGFGFAAAEHLLCKGARKVMITDSDADEGKMAAQRLCDAYGRDRVEFAECHVNNRCQFEAILNQARCKYKDIHIIFNDFDKDWSLTSNCMGKNENNTAKAIRVEMEVFGKKGNSSGRVIVNCASIFGFMGWPQEPFPVYCKKEPVIEVTQDFVKETGAEETGVRLVVLCPSNKHFSDIGLPDIPNPIPNNQMCELPPCVPTTKHQIGPALSHVLAWAQNGSVWLVEPAISVHQIPRLIHFPVEEGEKIDPNVYQTSSCSIKTTPPCVQISDHNKSKLCHRIKSKICNVKPPKQK